MITCSKEVHFQIFRVNAENNAGELIWKIKRFEGVNFQFEVLVPTDRQLEAVSVYHILCIAIIE